MTLGKERLTDNRCRSECVVFRRLQKCICFRQGYQKAKAWSQLQSNQTNLSLLTGMRTVDYTGPSYLITCHWAKRTASVPQCWQSSALTLSVKTSIAGLEYAWYRKMVLNLKESNSFSVEWRFQNMLSQQRSETGSLILKVTTVRIVDSL